MVTRCVLGEESEGSYDPATIATADNPCCANAAIPMPLEVHNIPANNDGACRKSTHCGETQRGVLRGKIMVNIHEDTKASNRQGNTEGDEREPEPRSVGEICCDDAQCEGCGKRRDGV